MPLILPNTIANGQDADGEKLQQNFASLQQWVNTEMVSRDGSTGMQQPLLLPGAPTQPDQAATKGYVDASTLVGEVKMWPGATEPAGYMFCRGQAVSRATYAALWAVLQGSGYGNGDGSSTFNLPDYKGRSPVGVNASGQFYSGGPGEIGGAGNSSLPSHVHGMEQHTHVGADHLHGISFNTSNASAEHGHALSHGLQVMYYGGSSGEWEIRAGDGLRFWAGRQTFVNDGSNHVHAVNGATQGADRGLTTSGATGHNTLGAGGGETGYSNYHPIQTINFIIKVQ